ncbi:MAG: hypothetical protein GX127_09735 [Eubacteriaceae bacterium]|nr:hypothetical protein [Eubacteriaceae bacterium]
MDTREGNMTIRNVDEEQIKDEIGEVYRWHSQEADKIYDDLVRKGDTPGLDSHREHFRAINEECDKRIHDILVKYGYREK